MVKAIKKDTEINVHLTFNGNCREAMTFYRDCLGGELFLQTVEESPGLWPAEIPKTVLQACLTKEKICLMGSDIGVFGKRVPGNTISLTLGCSSEEEIRIFFDRLSSGGKITHPLYTFYNGIIGAFTDRYGMNWVLKY